MCVNSTGVGAAPLRYDAGVEGTCNGSSTQSQTSSSNSVFGYIPGTIVFAAAAVAGLMV